MMRNPVTDESLEEAMQTVDLLCFSSQYYFLVSSTAMGSVVICLALEGLLRQNFNPFGDPATLLIFVACFAFGELLIMVLKILSNVQIRQLNWRGLWATKSIEGTVDDDVADKLAMGEGRQAE
jgi:hypothetical protein